MKTRNIFLRSQYYVYTWPLYEYVCLVGKILQVKFPLSTSHKILSDLICTLLDTSMFSPSPSWSMSLTKIIFVSSSLFSCSSVCVIIDILILSESSSTTGFPVIFQTCCYFFANFSKKCIKLSQTIIWHTL